MVLGANVVANRLPRFSFWLYVPLFRRVACSGWFCVNRFSPSVSRSIVLDALAVPLPVFFAGLIFSRHFGMPRIFRAVRRKSDRSR